MLAGLCVPWQTLLMSNQLADFNGEFERAFAIFA